MIRPSVCGARRSALLGGVLLVVGCPVLMSGQAATVRVMALGYLVGTRADPTPRARAETEVRVVQPMVMVDARAGRWLSARLSLNGEGLTLINGELTPGAWGEGFVDRRHPHTYVHELVAGAEGSLGCGGSPCRFGLVVGKGFAPFGSDDPMSRPLLRYPVNHHWAQILERAVAIGQLGRGPALLEAALFNGDEPERPGQWPRVGGRFGDSWSARLLIEATQGLEVSASLASVQSPEHRGGAAGRQRKAHVGVRWERDQGEWHSYGLAEWARTSELDGFFVFESWLAEGAIGHRSHRLQYRFERTDRPEEERLSAFRAVRPHLENSILGITRWTIHTLAYRYAGLQHSKLDLVPLLEASLGRVSSQVGTAFDLQQTYAKPTFLSVSVGFKLGWSVQGHRMGRYGIGAGWRQHRGHSGA